MTITILSKTPSELRKEGLKQEVRVKLLEKEYSINFSFDTERSYLYIWETGYIYELTEKELETPLYQIFESRISAFESCDVEVLACA